MKQFTSTLAMTAMKSYNVPIRAMTHARILFAKEVFVGSIPLEITAQDVMKEFAKFGECTMKKLLRGEDRFGYPKGTVTFTRAEDAKRAVDTMSTTNISGRNVRIKLMADDHTADQLSTSANNNNTTNNANNTTARSIDAKSNDDDSLCKVLVVDNLSRYVTEYKLTRNFKRFGECTSRIELTRPKCGFAIITFVRDEDADRAVKAFAEAKLFGQDARVKPYEQRSQKNWMSVDHVESSKPSSQLRGFGVNQRNESQKFVVAINVPKFMTQHDLITEFKQFGPCMMVCMSNSVAIVYFQSAADRRRAARALGGAYLFGQSVISFHQQPRMQTNASFAQREPVTAYRSLFLHNIPSSVTEADLQLAFSIHGECSVKIRRSYDSANHPYHLYVRITYMSQEIAHAASAAYYTKYGADWSAMPKLTEIANAPPEK